VELNQQIIACGDFLQLAPVGEDNKDQGFKTVTYAFDSKVWERLFPPQQRFNLGFNFRQGDDHFRGVLERMRRGYLSQRDHTLLKGLRRELELDEGMKPVHLLVTYKVTFAKKLMVVYRESWM